jgi:hypothetical protein
VRWLLDGELLKQIHLAPECFNLTTAAIRDGLEGETRCNVDPSKIILVNVRRSFHGNYSCQGRNRAGWGATSAATELKVLYPPKGANLTQQPAIVTKGNPFQVGN